MADVVKILRGNKAQLPTLETGVPAVCLDTKEFFIGGNDGNIAFPTDARVTQDETNIQYLQKNYLFIDTINGNDGNTGLSENAPFKTWDKLKEILIEYRAGKHTIIYLLSPIEITFPTTGSSWDILFVGKSEYKNEIVVNLKGALDNYFLSFNSCTVNIDTTNAFILSTDFKFYNCTINITNGTIRNGHIYIDRSVVNLLTLTYFQNIQFFCEYSTINNNAHRISTSDGTFFLSQCTANGAADYLVYSVGTQIIIDTLTHDCLAFISKSGCVGAYYNVTGSTKIDTRENWVEI